MIKSLSLRGSLWAVWIGLSSVTGQEPPPDSGTPLEGKPAEVSPSPKAAAEGEKELLAQEYLENVVIVRTEKTAGTGFMCTHRDKLFIATNQHVIDGSKSLSIEGPTGEKFKPISFIAARNVDIVLIGIEPGPNPRRPLIFGSTIEEVVAKGDEILVPGNSKGDGVITTTPGKIIGIGPNKIEVDCPVYPGNSGGPIFHVKTKQVIGLLTEASIVSLDGAVDAASFSDGKSQIKSEVRIFGHRFDTAEKWYAMNLADFRRNSGLMDKARDELTALEAFFYPVEGVNWKSFKDLHNAVNAADQTLGAASLSDADKAKAWTSLTGTLRSLTTRGLRLLEPHKRSMTFTQIKDLETLEQRSKYVLQMIDILTRNVEAARNLLQRDGR